MDGLGCSDLRALKQDVDRVPGLTSKKRVGMQMFRCFCTHLTASLAKIFLTIFNQRTGWDAISGRFSYFDSRIPSLKAKKP